MPAIPAPSALPVTDRTIEAAAWDTRVDKALALAPARLQRAVAWLRHPPRRAIRRLAGVLFILGGLLAILPVLGLWMLPLGFALLGEDSPALKAWLERTARSTERLWRRLRRSPR